MNFLNSFNFLDSFFGSDQPSNRYIDNFMNGLSGNRLVSDYFGKKEAVWIDTTNAFKQYVEIPELRAIVNRKAKMISQGKPCLIDSKGEKIENHWVLDLIKKPNPTQSWMDVIYSISVNDSLHSTSFCYAPKRSFGIVNLIVPLSSDKVQINTSGRSLKQMDKGGLIKDYKFNYDESSAETIDIEDMIMIQTTDGSNLINPVSKIESLKFPLSNIKASYNKRNVLLENMGSIGILTAKSSDIGGALPMLPEEKRKIQRDWYSRSKDEIIITETDVDFKPMSFPTKDLMLFEELTADKIAIIDEFGLNSYIFSNEKGSTFSNVKEGIRMVYTDTIIPEAEKYYSNLSEQLGLEEEGLRLTVSFDHIPVMQPDMESKANVLKIKSEALNKIKDSGVNLSEEEQRAILGID